jgi:predicted lipoprotein with Yx(FWY)xxD motif
MLAEHLAKLQVLSALMAADTRASKSSSAGKALAGGAGETASLRQVGKTKTKTLPLGTRRKLCSCASPHCAHAWPPILADQSVQMHVQWDLPSTQAARRPPLALVPH